MSEWEGHIPRVPVEFECANPRCRKPISKMVRGSMAQRVKFCSKACGDLIALKRRRSVEQEKCRSCQADMEFDPEVDAHRVCAECLVGALVVTRKGRVLRSIDGQQSATCSRCHSFQPVENFGAGNPNSALKLKSWCKTCSLAFHRTLSRGGLSHADQMEMFARQGGKCACCQTPISIESAHLDHDHATGIAREFLCQVCNLLEGRLATNQEGVVYFLRRNQYPAIEQYIESVTAERLEALS